MQAALRPYFGKELFLSDPGSLIIGGLRRLWPVMRWCFVPVG